LYEPVNDGSVVPDDVEGCGSAETHDEDLPILRHGLERFSGVESLGFQQRDKVDVPIYRGESVIGNDKHVGRLAGVCPIERGLYLELCRAALNPYDVSDEARSSRFGRARGIGAWRFFSDADVRLRQLR
jgi:hypothetical protein